MPKKVAISHAHEVCAAEESCGLAALVLIIVRFALRVLVNFFEQLRIEHRRTDAIRSARPLSKID